jgi:hypothetical protein
MRVRLFTSERLFESFVAHLVAADLKDLQSLKRPPRAPDRVVHLLKANRRRRQLPRVFEMHDKMAYAHAADFVAAESVGETAEIPNARFFMAVERPTVCRRTRFDSRKAFLSVR